MINPLDFEWLRWAGAGILTALLLLGMFIIFRYPLGKQASVSRRIAANRTYYIIMGLLLTFGGALFYAFLCLWLIPTYSVSPLVYILLIIAFIAQVILAWVPDKLSTTPRNHLFHLIHFAAGGTVAIIMALCLYFLCTVLDNLTFIGSIFVVLSAIFSTICLLLYIFAKQTRRDFLIYEVVFISLFSIAIYSLIFKI